ncbi:MAG: peptidoglycan D,D-transpeptidase FtsI family protein [Candidatus Microsaccharimonas sp.]
MKPELLKGSRSRILAGVVLAIATIFVIRLFYLQVVQHNFYVDLAQVEQVKKERLPAVRGEIYALNGESPVKLVMNETVYTVFVDPAVIRENDDADKIEDLMKKVAGGNVRPDFDELLVQKDSRYQIIATRVTRTQADKIKEEGLKGIGFQAVSQRVYPEGALASQVLGFVNAEGIGNYGVEGYLNDELDGVDGRLETVTDVSDVPLTVGDRNIREPAQDGTDLVLSIDRTVQSKLEEVIRAHAEKLGANVSAVVMDPNSGKVWGMANTPSYNPAEYYNVNDAALFNNDVISKVYEPGSTIKTFTMGTALDKNVAKASDTFYNTDQIRIGGYTIGNATRGMTGTITFQTAMEWSLNTGFVTIGQRMGDGESINRQARDTMYDYFHERFRLGQKTGIELASESAGRIVSPEESDGNAVRYSNMTFGQGMDATSIQVATGFSALINGGNYYKPTVLAGKVVNGAYVANATPTPLQSNIISENASQDLREMITTARKNSIGGRDKQGYMIGGKTGTAQIPEAGGYSNDETIASYLGFGGADRPEYVIMVAVYGENRVFQGARDASPIFTDMSNWMLDYLKLQPKG